MFIMMMYGSILTFGKNLQTKLTLPQHVSNL